jgi:hypothetical protein
LASEVFLNAVILVNGVEISGQTNELNLNFQSELLDETVFGSTTRLRKGGLKTFSFEGSGFFESGIGSVDELLFGAVGESNVVTVFPKAITEGDTGATGFAGRALEENYQLGGAVGSLLPISFSFQSREI